MEVKLLLFGQEVAIPKTPLKLGLGLISVWIDNNGFTSSTSDVGSIGYIFLETQIVPIGTPDSEKQQLFSNLHNKIVTFDIKPNLFVKNGGNARISMTIGVQEGGVAM